MKKPYRVCFTLSNEHCKKIVAGRQAPAYEEPFSDIDYVEVRVNAESITQAMDIAWKAVTLSPNEYEIEMVRLE